MSKYQNGDLVNYFEGSIYVYGLKQPLNIHSPTCVEFGLEFDNQEEFNQHYKIFSFEYYRCGNARKELKEDGYTYQYHEAKKGYGAMPITIWVGK